MLHWCCFVSFHAYFCVFVCLLCFWIVTDTGNAEHTNPRRNICIVKYIIIFKKRSIYWFGFWEYIPAAINHWIYNVFNTSTWWLFLASVTTYPSDVIFNPQQRETCDIVKNEKESNTKKNEWNEMIRKKKKQTKNRCHILLAQLLFIAASANTLRHATVCVWMWNKSEYHT